MILTGVSLIAVASISSSLQRREGKECSEQIELAKNAAEALKEEDVIVLRNHGVIATGSTVKEAATLVEFVEESAKTQFVTLVLNSIK